MLLTYLGTAASEGVPALFCACPACARARLVGGLEVRTRSGALIDESLKIDFPPDAYMQSLRHGLDFSKLRHVLITHTHSDHFCPREFENRLPPYSQLRDSAPPLRVYGNADGLSKMRNLTPGMLEYTVIEPYNEYDVGGYSVTPLRAVHAKEQVAMFYIIEKGRSALLYAHDTDEFTDEHIEFMRGRHFTCVSLDCTNGVLEPDYIGHMGINDDLRMREKLLEIGAADENTVFVANHFSHNGIRPYAEMEKLLGGLIKVSYDGMKLQI